MIDNIKILEKEVLSHDQYLLQKITYEYTKEDGSKHTKSKEAYDNGNGATILLYNHEKKTVILTKQFRLPTFFNGNQSGQLIETCAGIIENESPEDCVIREAEEETGYKISDIKKVFEAHMSPATVLEIVHFFIAHYTEEMKVSAGGGAEGEEENIEVLELEFEEALKMVESGEIKDAKAIILLQYIRLNNIL